MIYPPDIIVSAHAVRLTPAHERVMFDPTLVHSVRRWLMPWAMLLLGLLLLTLAGKARADCWSFSGQPGSVTFAPPATITLPNSLPVGTVLWASQPTASVNPPTLICSDNTNSGVVNSIGGQPSGGDDTLFPTNILGLSFELLQPDTSNPLHAYPNQSIGTGIVPLNAATVLQLVVTGPITAGSVLVGGQFAQWNVDVCNFHNDSCRGNKVAPSPLVVFNISGITFLAPACTIAVDSTVVTLPTVFSSNFAGGVGSTAGQTPFNIQLNCSAGSSVSITLSPNTPAFNGAPGVLANTGPAQNVGVQILNANGGSGCASPITFNTAIPEGATPSGPMNLYFCAQYYQTGASVTGGNVNATATYTITYQ